jgi:CheY-like chemotaxis protein
MPKILLVEDNEMNREMLSRRLVRKGYEVVIAVDGLQGVAMSVAEKPNLILMDMSLPGIDGWEATRRIKADLTTRGIPVIALTAHAMSDDRAKALAAGCDDFDTKPVDLARLLNKMDDLLAATEGHVQVKESVATVSPSAHSATLTLSAVHASLSSFKAELEHFCMQAGVTTQVQQDLQVVLDEVCANVLKHAYPPGQSGLLRLDLRIHNGQSPLALGLTLTDQGRPFNPLAKPAPDTSLNWEERPIGGLGIHLIQTLTDEQSYSHSEAEGNRLTLVKRLA